MLLWYLLRQKAVVVGKRGFANSFSLTTPRMAENINTGSRTCDQEILDGMSYPLDYLESRDPRFYEERFAGQTEAKFGFFTLFINVFKN